MVIKLWLPEYTWHVILAQNDKYNDTIDSFIKALQKIFIPRIKEMINDYEKGLVNEMVAYFKRFCVSGMVHMPYNLIVEIEKLLCERKCMIDFTEVEYLISYALWLFIAEGCKKAEAEGKIIDIAMADFLD